MYFYYKQCTDLDGPDLVNQLQLNAGHFDHVGLCQLQTILIQILHAVHECVDG